MNTQHIKLSVLDQSPVRKGDTARQAILETIALAKFTEKLGYQRFWVSEHHNAVSLAGSTPEVLIAHLASQTQHIRVGSGGVMMPNHSTLKVAENFRMLETLYPGRIDLGMGRAPGGDRFTASILNPSNTFSEKDFVQQLYDLQHYLYDKHNPDIQPRVRAIPITTTVPELWLLSSSGQSGLFAAHFGMGLSFAHFINPTGGPEAVSMYRERFKPSEQLAEPVASLGIFVMCADTEEKAAQLQATMDVQMLHIEQGIRQGFSAYEDIRDYQFTSAERERVMFNRQRMVSGTPEQVKDKLTKLAAAYEVDEIMAVTITYDFADRLRSYELLAEAFVPAAFAGEPLDIAAKQL